MISYKEVVDLFKYVENKSNTVQFSYRKINPEFLTPLNNLKGSAMNAKNNPTRWNTEQTSLLHFPPSMDSAYYKATIVTPIIIQKVEERKGGYISGGFGELSLVYVTYKLKEADDRTITRPNDHERREI